jgi:hypothetical protein
MNKHDDGYYSDEAIERRYQRRVAEINARYEARMRAILIVLAVLAAPIFIKIIALFLDSVFN